MLGFLAKHVDHRQCKRLQFGQIIFRSTAKGSLSNFIPILYWKMFMLCTKAVYKDLSLELNIPFAFQLRT